MLFPSRFLSIKWKVFAPTSILLSLVFLGFVFSNALHLQSQFDHGRTQLAQYHRQQLESLLNLNVLRNQQLLTSVGSGVEVIDALVSGDPDRIQTSLAEPFWALNMEVGANDLSVYTAEGELLATLGDALQVPSLLAAAREEERPQWQVNCGESNCEMALVMPLLAGRDIVLMAMSASLGDLVVQFSQMTGADIAVLTDRSETLEEGAEDLPHWDRNIAAMTRLSRTRSLLMSLDDKADLNQMRFEPLVLQEQGATREIRVFAWQGTDLVMINDITDEQREIDSAIHNSVLFGTIALILAELLLLWLLWKPMTRLRQTAAYLPWLAENKFDDMRLALNKLARQRLFDDESDVLSATAVRVSQRLEAMQSQLHEHNEELSRRSAELQGERDFVRQLLNTIPALIMMLDRDGNIVMINQHGAEMTGYSREELEGLSVGVLVPEEVWKAELRSELAELLAHRCTNVRFESQLLCKTGTSLHMAWHNTLIHDRDRNEELVLSVALDITARKSAEEKMSWLASRDALTGLYNRRRFTEELNQVVDRNKRQGNLSAVMFFDLDQFKDINDTSGHQTGDLLLKRIAQRLLDIGRDSDFVARLDGDEFAVIANNVNPEDMAGVAERYARALSQVHVEGKTHRHRCTASIGVAMIPWHGDTVEDLLANADLAMYRAKEAGRNQWQMFDPKEDTTERVRERVYWNDKVDQVLKTGDFEIYFQPLMDMETGKIAHYEALLRVFSDEGQLATGLFIQAAERNGAIHVLDERVVERVMAHQAELVRNGIEACIAINLSGASFQHPERLLQHIEQLLRRYPIAASSLIFEITETAAVKDINVTRQHITLLREQGFKFALDDFGVGFSSLFYLKQLPVDYLKIDGSFIRNLCNEPDDQALVQALVQVAKIYRLKTVAEFVENQDIVELLKTYKVDYAQGYHIGKPLPFNETFFADRPVAQS
ncbi:bifunctional diguanylate cyclase/phosphodiesterase [Hydrocarboniclastica marina]|uniref:EAL domain-containing protein n=1 Tax=Hydrocarboniclastica marina TaxID=2259620 RepID=A0A4P7XKD4_9ALTE|nr:EAL domain-containing protein [Hydrocarboniclastica marina]QCF27676.1 EAL domain-containing protein [Hydrocarboniclastica marina]